MNKRLILVCVAALVAQLAWDLSANAQILSWRRCGKTSSYTCTPPPVAINVPPPSSGPLPAPEYTRRDIETTEEKVNVSVEINQSQQPPAIQAPAPNGLPEVTSRLDRILERLPQKARPPKVQEVKSCPEVIQRNSHNRKDSSYDVRVTDFVDLNFDLNFTLLFEERCGDDKDSSDSGEKGYREEKSKPESGRKQRATSPFQSESQKSKRAKCAGKVSDAEYARKVANQLIRKRTRREKCAKRPVAAEAMLTEEGEMCDAQYARKVADRIVRERKGDFPNF